VYSATWSPGFRQGDVLGKLFFPNTGRLTVVSQGQLAGDVTPANDRQYVEAREYYVLVISHDCEFNEGKRTHFAVARIEPLASRLKADELELLRLGNDVERAAAENRNVPLDTFYLDPIQGIWGGPRRANLGVVTSYPMEIATRSDQFKKAELAHEHRVLLRRKLGVFFGRDAEDIPEAEKTAPPEQLAPQG
jgi:hypothetical protein